MGYVIGICSLIIVLALKLNEAVEICLTFIFTICVSVSHVKIMHYKMMERDYNYKIRVNDERNERIRDKTNATMAFVLMFLIGIIAVVCISVKAYLPAVLSIVFVVASPLIMYFINRYYEKKY